MITESVRYKFYSKFIRNFIQNCIIIKYFINEVLQELTGTDRLNQIQPSTFSGG